MKELRKFHRLPSSKQIELVHEGQRHQGCLDNISLNGALVRLDDAPGIDDALPCLLRILLEEGAGADAILELSCRVVHGSANLVGVRFLECDAEASRRLSQLIEQMKNETEKMEHDLERIRGYLAQYCGPR